MTQIKQLFDAAVSHHQAGRLSQAEPLYRQILAQQPNHPDAMHLLGVIAQQVGRSDSAVELIQQAIQIKPNYPEAYNNLGNALRDQGKPQQAMAAYQKALAIRPNYADVHCSIGNLMATNGQIDQAISTYRQALAIRPDYAEACCNLGNALNEKGLVDAAIASHRRAIAIRSNYPEAHYNLGNALNKKGEIKQAAEAFRQAIALKPDLIEAYQNFGNALKALGRVDEAIAVFLAGIAQRPNYAQLYLNLGNALTDARQSEPAVAAFRKAIELRPDYVEAFNNLGNVLKDLGQIDESIDAYRQAIVVQPDYPEAHSNLGVALSSSGKFDQAIESFRRAIALRPEYSSANYNLSLAMLISGQLSEGWKQHEWRWRWAGFPSPRRNFTQPQWDGSALPDGTLLVHAEQGFGDTLHFIRYVLPAARRCKRVAVWCQPELRRLIEPMPGVAQWVSWDEPPPQFDVHCPLLTLPMAFDTTLESIPKSVPYLRADARDIERWRERIAGQSAGLKVGLVWAGNPAFKSDRLRSPGELSLLAPLAAAKNAQFHSLQKGDAARQAGNPPAGMQLIDWTAELNDFGDTAAMISNLDLVITSDTAVAHLAGALGKPVWTMLAFVPDWRWLMDRTDCPWYPTMRLFRQPAIGDWSSVIREIYQALRVLSGTA